MGNAVRAPTYEGLKLIANRSSQFMSYIVDAMFRLLYRPLSWHAIMAGSNIS